MPCCAACFLSCLMRFACQVKYGGKAQGRIGRVYYLETCHFLAVLVHDLMGTPKIDKNLFLGINVLRPGLGGCRFCFFVAKCCSVLLQPCQGVCGSTASATMLHLGC